MGDDSAHDETPAENLKRLSRDLEAAIREGHSQGITPRRLADTSGLGEDEVLRILLES